MLGVKYVTYYIKIVLTFVDDSSGTLVKYYQVNNKTLSLIAVVCYAAYGMPHVTEMTIVI